MKLSHFVDGIKISSFNHISYCEQIPILKLFKINVFLYERMFSFSDMHAPAAWEVLSWKIQLEVDVTRSRRHSFRSIWLGYVTPINKKRFLKDMLSIKKV